MKTVIGLFNNFGDATSTLGDFSKMGLTADRVGLLSSAQGAHATAGLSQLELPEIGRAAANQPMLTWLKSPGGIAGALVRLGVSRNDAQRCIDTLRRGGTLEAVLVEDGKEADAQAIMQARSARYEDTDDLVIPVVAEELEVGKRVVESGGVRVSTHVRSVPVEKTVTIREEHVRIERRTIDRPVAERDAAFQDRAYELKASAEEPYITKRAHVVEEIRVHKDASEHEERIQDRLRHTEVDVSEIPGYRGTPKQS
ncbi:MAG: YsnF/AvaK domain-containing protein [Myxococcales bacterium]